MPFTEYTANDLIYRIKMYDFSTGAQIQYEDTDLLKFADDVIKEDIAPVLMQMNETFYLVNDDINFTANQSTYDLPPFAMYNMVHSVKYLSSAGTEFNIEPVPVNRTYVRNYLSSGQPSNYYIENNSVSFFPPPASALDKYRIFYYRRPSFLTKNENVAIVANVNKTTGLVTYAALPASGFTASSVHDFYSSNSPFNRLQQAVTATAQAGVTQTFPAASVQTLNVGDAVAVTGYTHVPEIPVELQRLLIRLVISKIAIAQNDSTKFQLSQTEIQEKIEQALQIPGHRITNQAISLNVLNSPNIRGIV